MGGMIVPIIGKIADVAGLQKALAVVGLLPIIGFLLSLLLPEEERQEILSSETTG